MSNTNPAPQFAHFGVLACALAGRTIDVQGADPGQLSWTNGSVIYLDRSAAASAQLQALCVQCALLAAGSLVPQIVRRLVHRPERTRRYLALEAERALCGLQNLLPPSMHSLVNRIEGARSRSPQMSLQLAAGDDRIEAPLPVFGQIRVRSVLAAQTLATSGTSADRRHVPRPQRRRQALESADELPDAEDGEQDVASSPVGGGGPVGRLLQKLMQMTRRLRGGGPPGADAATSLDRSNAGARVGAALSSAQAETIDATPTLERGEHYPEWDAHQGHYRPDWCVVTEVEAPHDRSAAVEWTDGHDLRRPLARLGMGLDRVRHRVQGDDIDIDAAIDAHIERVSGRTPHDDLYIESLRRRRDLSVLILLDVSGSVSQRDAGGVSVHEKQRRVAARLTTVLYEVGDRVALYAFHSQGRAAVHLMPLKRFDEGLDSLVMRRLHSIVPGAYSRLGAAIRHGGRLLLERGGTSRRLLLVLSDGLAYDHGYEPAYGAADARRALAEARSNGIGCLCLSIGAGTDADVLRRVFGSAAHASVPDDAELGALIGPLFRSALKRSEVRRRAA